MPRLPLALIRRLVPGDVGEGLAREVESAYHRDRVVRGAWRAGVTAWREALAPSVWTLRRELRRPAVVRPSTLNSPSGDPIVLRLLEDLRFAVRTLAKRPAFTATAILILGVGIGASTTIFTVVDHVLLRPLPYDAPEGLVTVDNASFSVPQFLAWKEGSADTFSEFAAVAMQALDLTGEATPMRVRAAAVTPGFLGALRITPARGRDFVAQEYSEETTAALVSFGAWQSIFGGDPDIVGRAVDLDGRRRTIVGVLPASFRPPEQVTGRQVAFWLPFDADREGRREDWGSWYLQILGRLAPETTLEVARERVDRLSEQLIATNPAGWDDNLDAYRMRVLSLHEATVDSVGSALYLLLGAVGLMLLIACANVASLLLARATDRTREVAVRAVLGASRGHILQQLVAEAMVLSAAGGALGVALALGGVELFNRLQPGNIPLSEAVAVDLRILGFAVAVALMTGLVFGLAPAWRASRADLSESIRDGSGTLSASAARQRLRSALVVVEVALAVVLTLGAGLLFGSFMRLAAVDPGFEPDDVLAFRLGFSSFEPEERLAFVDDVSAAMRAVPGAEAVGVGVTIPFQLTGEDRCCWFDEMVTDEDANERHWAVVDPVDHGYFEALGARFRHGRDFRADDGAEDPVAILTATTANEMFGRDDVVGQVLHIDGGLDVRIVGVVEDLRHWGLNQETGHQLYLPYRGFQQYFNRASFLVRGDRDDLAAAVREAIWSVNPSIPVQDITTMTAMVEESVAAPRFYSGIFVVFSGLALVLAAGGLYGVMMFQVGQRSREMGIRLALGARGSNVVAMVVRQGLALTAVGLLVGLAAAQGLARWLESMLFEVRVSDGATMAAVAAVLMAVGALACYVPARRAGRADPLVTLKAQ